MESSNMAMDAPINLAIDKNAAKVDRAGLGGPLVEHHSQSGEHPMESGRVCRICLEEEEDFQSGNPFITPCKCTGSMKYIHLKCLREWTDSKKQFLDQGGIVSYYWENLACELCKAQLELVVRSPSDPDKAVFLLDLQRPIDSPYMILESDFESTAKAVHILDLGAKTTFSIGRRISNDISITDISVSRVHAEINFIPADEKLYLSDCDSKFGTFKQVPSKPLAIKRTSNLFCLPVQIEKKCFFFRVQPRFSTFERLCTNCFKSKARTRTDMLCHDYFIRQFTKFPQGTRTALMGEELQKLRQTVQKM